MVEQVLAAVQIITVVRQDQVLVRTTIADQVLRVRTITEVIAVRDQVHALAIIVDRAAVLLGLATTETIRVQLVRQPVLAITDQTVVQALPDQAITEIVRLVRLAHLPVLVTTTDQVVVHLVRVLATTVDRALRQVADHHTRVLALAVLPVQDQAITADQVVVLAHDLVTAADQVAVLVQDQATTADRALHPVHEALVIAVVLAAVLRPEDHIAQVAHHHPVAEAHPEVAEAVAEAAEEADNRTI